MKSIKVFNPRFVPLKKSSVELLANAVLAEVSGKMNPLSRSEYPVLLEIVTERIELMDLPISFNEPAKLGLLSFVSIPGEVIVLLIDALNKFEGKVVTVKMLCDELYPFGFYDQESFETYVEKFIKPHKVKWSHVYGKRVV